MTDMTEKLFYKDSHQKSFAATVTGCMEKDGFYWIVLDKTVFFPEGGGQYADTGILSPEPPGEKCAKDTGPLDGKWAEVGRDAEVGLTEIGRGMEVGLAEGERGAEVGLAGEGLSGARQTDRGRERTDLAHVTDVREMDGLIYHKSDKPFAVGSTVYGRINWGERFGKMQQHTGEHIVSGLVHAVFGCDNVGFHLGDTYCTMDFNGEIREEELRRIEMLANEAVVKNLDVEVLYPSREELAGMEYRSKIEIEGQVRIVVIPGYDTCACCAPHVKKTGEIGLIRLTDSQRYKGGVRLTMLCGFRALQDYRVKSASVRRISHSLCAKEDEVYGAVEHVKEECARLRQLLVNKQKEIFAYKVKGLDTNESGVACMFEESLDGDDGRILMNLALEAGCAACAVFWKNEKGDAYRYCIGSTSRDVRGLGKALNARFQGRGGGKPEMVQGSLSGDEKDLREWMQKEGREWLQ